MKALAMGTFNIHATTIMPGRGISIWVASNSMIVLWGTPVLAYKRKPIYLP